MKTNPSNRESQPTHSVQIAELPLPLIDEGDAPNRVCSLSTDQEQALEWLIGGGSIAEAAQFAGVTRQTISRWMRTDPDFRAVYDAWKMESSQMLEGRLIAAGESAMENLLNAVRTKQDVRASQFVVKTLMEIRKRTQG
jgi:transposase